MCAHWICKSLGGVICIKNVKYGGTYAPKEDERAKTTRQPTGDNALDAIKEDIARIQDELIKQNRDNLDAMYNIDTDNFSSSLKKTFGNALAQIQLNADANSASAEMLAQFENSIASIKATADKNSASISNIASWQTDTENSISSIQQTANSAESKATAAVSYANEAKSSAASVSLTANANSARIDNIVSLKGTDGTDLYAAFTVAAEGDESFIKAIADKVEISAGEIDLNGYVKFTDLSNNEGSTVISGNLINMLITAGQGETSAYDAVSDAGLLFKYDCHMYYDNIYGKILAEISGETTDVSSRYRLTMATEPVPDWYGEYTRFPGIKLRSCGRMSITSGLDEDGFAYDDNEGNIYMATGGGTITMQTQYGVRIRPLSSYSTSTSAYTPAANDYVFCTDGIWYNGTKLIST